jgi:NAD(P)H-dependent FMN reductase
MKKVSTSIQSKSRRTSVLERLTKQLKSGLKTEKKSTDGKQIPLTDKDKTRIEKEIEVLKTRL